MTISLREVAFRSKEYDSVLDLRYRVLREPLGLRFKDEDLAREKDDFHLAAYQGDQLVACLLLSPVSNTEMRMRQVAVEPALQGQGIGRWLVKEAESFARERGCERFRLRARETAVPFYRSLGYLVEGEGFSEIGLPHRVMRKDLIPAQDAKDPNKSPVESKRH